MCKGLSVVGVRAVFARNIDGRNFEIISVSLSVIAVITVITVISVHTKALNHPKQTKTTTKPETILKPPESTSKL